MYDDSNEVSHLSLMGVSMRIRGKLAVLLSSVVLASTLSVIPPTIWVGAIDPPVTNGTKPQTGDGSASNPYRIDQATELIWMQENYLSILSQHFIQTADIDMSTLPDGVAFSPIGGIVDTNYQYFFTGSYDGQGFAIRNLQINSSLPEVALFQITDAGSVIQDVHLVNANISSSSTYNYSGTAGIVSYAGGGTISRCSVTGVIQHTSNTFGGNVAGIAGLNYGAAITNSYCTASLQQASAGGNIAGITGYTGRDSCSVTNCYFAGTLSGVTTGKKGGLVGNKYLGSIANSYYLIPPNDPVSGKPPYYDVGGVNADQYAAGRSESQLKTEGTFTTWDFTTVWSYSSGNMPDFQTKPSDLTGESILFGDQSADLTWSPSLRAGSYRIDYGLSETELTSHAVTSATAFTLTGLTNGVPVYAQITPIHNAEEGKASAVLHTVPIPALSGSGRYGGGGTFFLRRPGCVVGPARAPFLRRNVCRRSFCIATSFIDRSRYLGTYERGRLHVPLALSDSFRGLLQ